MTTTHPDLSDAALRVLALLAREPVRSHRLAELGMGANVWSLAATLERRGLVTYQRRPLLGRGVATLAITVAGLREVRRNGRAAKA